MTSSPLLGAAARKQKPRWERRVGWQQIGKDGCARWQDHPALRRKRGKEAIASRALLLRPEKLLASFPPQLGEPCESCRFHTVSPGADPAPGRVCISPAGVSAPPVSCLFWGARGSPRPPGQARRGSGRFYGRAGELPVRPGTMSASSSHRMSRHLYELVANTGPRESGQLPDPTSTRAAVRPAWFKQPDPPPL